MQNWDALAINKQHTHHEGKVLPICVRITTHTLYLSARPCNIDIIIVPQGKHGLGNLMQIFHPFQAPLSTQKTSCKGRHSDSKGVGSVSTRPEYQLISQHIYYSI